MRRFIISTAATAALVIGSSVPVLAHYPDTAIDPIAACPIGMGYTHDTEYSRIVGGGGRELIIISHDSDAMRILGFDLKKEKFRLLHENRYPYGESTLDTANSSFYTRGQFGDAIFETTRIKSDDEGRLWVTDFLAGKLFILDSDRR